MSPALILKLLAAGCAVALAVLLFVTPDLFDRIVRGGDPMEPLSRERLNLLRVVLAPFVAGALAFCLLNRKAVGWRPLQILIFALPLFAIAVVAVYKIAFGSADPRYLMFVREDGPIEYATAVVFLMGAAVARLAAALARDLQTRGFLVLFGFAMLFVALSEISFGQRLLGLETPDALLEINRQQEISVHNIYGIEYVVYGVLPHLIFAYALFSRVVARWLEGSALSRELLAVAPFPWYAVPCFLPMVIFSAKEHVVHALGRPTVFQDQEPSELFLGAGFLLVAVNAWLLLRRQASPRLEQPRSPATRAAQR